MPVELRPVEPRDFEDVTRLLAELGGGRPPMPADPQARARVQAAFDAMLARMARDEAFASVAAEEGATLGVITADVRSRLNQETPEVWVADLVVTDAQRGRGIGKRLLAAVVDDARRLGAHRISLESGHWRKDAHRFYKREGWDDVALHFALSLTRRT